MFVIKFSVLCLFLNPPCVVFVTSVLCCVNCFYVFFYLNFKQNLNNIENKLKLLENGLYQHGKEVLDIRRQIDHLNVNGGPNDQKESESQIAEPKASLNKNDMFKDMVINADEYQKCSIGAEMVPPDIQVM